MRILNLAMATLRTLAAGLTILAAFPVAARAAIVLDLSDGGGSVVNYAFSGSTTLNDPFSVDAGAPSLTSLRLPSLSFGSDSWTSYFRSGEFDDPGSELLNVTNVTTGTVAASGNPALSIDGVPVGKVGGGFAADGDWQVEFFDDPSFEFAITDEAGNLSYPSLTGGETLSISGAGSFDVGTGTFSTNFNVGTYNFTGTTSGLQTQINVVPEPGAAALAFGGIATFCLGGGAVTRWKKRRLSRTRTAGEEPAADLPPSLA